MGEATDRLSRDREAILIHSFTVRVEGRRPAVVRSLSTSLLTSGQLTLLTDLSPVNICQGATDPWAIGELFAAAPTLSLRHLPRVHAKVYVADEAQAVVSSANLTDGGLARNFEYGLSVSAKSLVTKIRSDLDEYSYLGAPISAEQLRRFCDIADRVRARYRQQQQSAAKSATAAFREAMLEAEEELIRRRLGGRPIHAVFERTIPFLLRREGAQRTASLHAMVAHVHPDLCDNSIDRVIDGKCYGRKWKHAVRTAQQHLKARGVIRYTNGVWELVRP